jgi:hypothetical protein
VLRRIQEAAAVSVGSHDDGWGLIASVLFDVPKGRLHHRVSLIEVIRRLHPFSMMGDDGVSIAARNALHGDDVRALVSRSPTTGAGLLARSAA